MEAPTFSIYVAIFLVSLTLSSLLVPLLRKIAFRYSVLDRPNQSHKTHQESIPYLGGLAIVIPVSLLVIIGPLIFIENSDYLLRTALLLLPAVLLALVGLYDDIKNLSASSRFFVQSLIAVSATLFLSNLDYSVSILSNETGNLLLSIFWLVGITNAFNFFDNLDGGATGITIVASLTLYIRFFGRSISNILNIFGPGRSRLGILMVEQKSCEDLSGRFGGTFHWLYSCYFFTSVRAKRRITSCLGAYSSFHISTSNHRYFSSRGESNFKRCFNISKWPRPSIPSTNFLGFQ